MKLLVIPDLHGKTCWKERINQNDWDKVIFLGDYVDAWSCKDDIMLNNLLDIIQFRKDNMNRVVLLLGNHDIQYLYFPNYQCSGFRPGIASSLHYIYKENKDLFQIAYQINDYLFTHAGISSKWYNKYIKDIEDIWSSFSTDEKGTSGSFADILNCVSHTSNDWILYEVGSMRGGLRGNLGGPLWADKDETMEGIPKGFIQIVGHTPIPTGIKEYNKVMGTTYEDRSITYTDCLDTIQEYLLLNIEEND